MSPPARVITIRILPLLVPLLILLVTGLRGLDFGFHWDERHYQIGPVGTMVRDGRLTPGYYGYPSLNYWISQAALAPDAASALARQVDVRDHLLTVIGTHEYLLRLRAVYLLIAALTAVWVYLAMLAWRKSVAEAFLAASFLALSWEVAYHARWVATDGVLMQFGGLTLLLVALSEARPPAKPWLYAAAFAAGLGAGAKYPGALLLVPVLLASILPAEHGPWRERIRQTLALGALGFSAFVLTTPAVLVDTAALVEGIRYEVDHYASGHGGHTVARGPEHLLRMVDYFGLAFFSTYTPLAAAVGLLVLLGVWAVRRDPRMGLLLLSFPVAYLLYFSTQRAMVVRNLLVVAPFLAVFAARGAGLLLEWRRSREPASRGSRKAVARAAMGVLTVILLANAFWLWRASESIRVRQSAQFVAEAVDHVRSRPNTVFYLSPRVAAHFARVEPGGVANTTREAANAQQVLFYAHEAMRLWEEWPANRRTLTQRWFGPHEVNFNIYPNWWGDDRIVSMSAASAARLELLIFPASLP